MVLITWVPEQHFTAAIIDNNDNLEASSCTYMQTQMSLLHYIHLYIKGPGLTMIFLFHNGFELSSNFTSKFFVFIGYFFPVSNHLGFFLQSYSLKSWISNNAFFTLAKVHRFIVKMGQRYEKFDAKNIFAPLSSFIMTTGNCLMDPVYQQLAVLPSCPPSCHRNPNKNFCC